MGWATVTNGVPAGVAEQLAAEAAACWVLRDAAVRSPSYDLLELCALDDRLERHLEGLRLAGGLGWEACAAEADGGDGGEVFAAAAISLARRDWRGFARVLDAGAGDPGLARPIVSAIGWSAFDAVSVALAALLAPGAPAALRYVGVAGHAIHRRDPGGALATAARSSDLRLRARALRAIGELQRTDLGDLLRSSLTAEDAPCRFWASWSAALLRDDRAMAVLQDLAQGGGPFAERAAEMAVRRMDPAAARVFLESLPGGGATGTRAALVGAGALGDPALVPFLLSHLRDERTARLAAWSIDLITNAGAARGTRGKRPPGFAGGPNDDPADPDVAMGPDEDRAWPDPAGLEAFWHERGKEMPAGVRHFFGRPMRPEWLAHVLGRGNQAARAAAAVELCLSGAGHEGGNLFEVRAPGYAQWKALAPS